MNELSSGQNRPKLKMKTSSFKAPLNPITEKEDDDSVAVQTKLSKFNFSNIVEEEPQEPPSPEFRFVSTNKKEAWDGMESGERPYRPPSIAK